jgi:argininosuccinate synthase
LASAVDTQFQLHNPGAVYAQSCDWTPEEAVGFIKLMGQSTTLAGKVRGKGQ